MRLRDAQYSAYSVVFVLGGVTPATRTALPGALHDLVRRNESLHLRWPRRAGEGARHSLQSALRTAADAVTTYAPELDDAQLIAAVAERGFSGIPISAATSGDRVVVMISHAIEDGAGALVLLHDLIDLAAGVQPVVDAVPIARHPLRTAVRAAGIGSFVALLGRHRERRLPIYQAPEPSVEQERRSTARFASRMLAGADLRQVTTASFPVVEGGRTSQNTRIAALLLGTLQRVYRSDRDLRVFVPVDLRHHVKGRRVTGNFVSVAPVGALLDRWNPAELTERLKIARSGIGVASLVMGILRHLRASLRPAMPWREYSISVSIVRSPRAFPAEAWIDPAAARLGAAAVGAWPSAVFVLIWTVGRTVHCSVWDETGLFDVARVGDAFDAEVASHQAGVGAQSERSQPPQSLR